MESSRQLIGDQFMAYKMYVYRCTLYDLEKYNFLLSQSRNVLKHLVMWH